MGSLASNRLAMQDARELLGRAQALFDRARDHVRDTTDGDPIDTAQVQVYDLAFSAAELTGAKALLDYAELQASPEDLALKARIANTFCAETVSNLIGRLAARPGDYGLSATDLDLGQGAFCDAHQSASELASHLRASTPAWTRSNGTSNTTTTSK